MNRQCSMHARDYVIFCQSLSKELSIKSVNESGNRCACGFVNSTVRAFRLSFIFCVHNVVHIQFHCDTFISSVVWHKVHCFICCTCSLRSFCSISIACAQFYRSNGTLFPCTAHLHIDHIIGTIDGLAEKRKLDVATKCWDNEREDTVNS